jgi:hypothetical protein
MAIAVARFVMERAVNASVSSTLHSTNSSMKDSDNDGQSTSELIGALKFAASKSIRTSTIILAAFNVLAAFITAFSILYDCYFASKRCNPKFKASYVTILHDRICADCGRKFCIKSIHPAETFPLVLAVGIVVQGLAFAGVQGEGLQSSNTTGCSLIAQFMWPGMWLRFWKGSMLMNQHCLLCRTSRSSSVSNARFDQCENCRSKREGNMMLQYVLGLLW